MAQAGGGGSEDFEITNINVTPLVDIMLVLLIIFLVTATYIVKEAIPIDLPRAASASESPPRTLEVVIAKDGKTSVNGVEATSDAVLRQTVRAAAKSVTEVQAVIRADRDARHGAVVHALDLLRTEGVTKFAIEVEKEGAP